MRLVYVKVPEISMFHWLLQPYLPFSFFILFCPLHIIISKALEYRLSSAFLPKMSTMSTMLLYWSSFRMSAWDSAVISYVCVSAWRSLTLQAAWSAFCLYVYVWNLVAIFVESIISGSWPGGGILARSHEEGARSSGGKGWRIHRSRPPVGPTLHVYGYLVHMDIDDTMLLRCVSRERYKTRRKVPCHRGTSCMPPSTGKRYRAQASAWWWLFAAPWRPCFCWPVWSALEGKGSRRTACCPCTHALQGSGLQLDSLDWIPYLYIAVIMSGEFIMAVSFDGRKMPSGMVAFEVCQTIFFNWYGCAQEKAGRKTETHIGRAALIRFPSISDSLWRSLSVFSRLWVLEWL